MLVLGSLTLCAVTYDNNISEYNKNKHKHDEVAIGDGVITLLIMATGYYLYKIHKQNEN